MKIKNIISVLLILSLWTQPVFAETATNAEIRESLKNEIREADLTNCRVSLGKAFDFEMKEFFVFLEENFQNKSSTSSLTNTAISRYAELKSRMEEYFSILSFKVGDETQTFASSLGALEECSAIRDAYVQGAKQQMIEHIRNNSAQKRSTVMVEKYQSINNQLRELNLNVAKMYGFFATFKDKLPAFTKYCRKSLG